MGRSAARDAQCRAAGGRMERSKSTVRRGLVLLEADAVGELTTVTIVAVVAIAKCNRCGARARVLPCEVLPRKTFGLTVIEHEVARYAHGDRSLRQVAWSQLGEKAPAHTTLHGWTEGLGAHALGRPGGDAGGAPMSRFVTEATSRAPEVAGTMRALALRKAKAVDLPFCLCLLA